MKKIILLLLLSQFSLFAQITDISFNSNNWNYSSSFVSLDGATGVLTMREDTTGYFYHTATLDVNLPTIPQTLYFSAEIYLDNYKTGSESWDKFKLKIYDNNNNKLLAYNIDETTLSQNSWIRVVMKIEDFDKKGVSDIILEFGMQNCEGTVKIKNPLLTAEQPTLTPYSFPWSIPSDVSCNINIKSGDTTKFNSDLLSTNSHFSWSNTSWGDTVLQNFIIKELPMTNLRFPGGTVGNFYNWHNDQYFSDSATFTSASRKSLSEAGWKFGFDGYAELCKKLKASSTLMFNVMYDDTNSQKERLQNRINAGLNIKWIELGNENYYGPQSYGYITTQAGKSEVNTYIDFTKKVVKALKNVDKNIKCAVNINNDSYGDGSWSNTLSKENYFDATVIHQYFNPGYDDLNMISGRYLLSVYKKLSQELARYKENFPNTPTIVTEYGILETPESFLRVIGYADMLMAFIEGNLDGVVMQAGMHMLNHGGGFGNGQWLYKDDDANKIYLTTAGLLYSQIFKNFVRHSIYKAMSSSAQLEDGLPAVNAKAFDCGDSIKFFVVNKLPVSSILKPTIDGKLYSGSYTIKYLQKDINEDLTEPASPYSSGNDDWIYETNSNEITIPAYSISIVSIKKEGTSNIKSSNSHLNNEIILYPNPCKSTLNLSTYSDYELYNSKGKLIDKGKNSRIDLTKFKKGVYYIKIKNRFYSITKVD